MTANKTICSFNRDWIDKTLNPQFSSWLKEVPTDRHKAHCSLCLKNFELSSMGCGAVTSHLRSNAHARNSGAADTSRNISSMLIKKVTVDKPPVATSTDQLLKILNVSAAATLDVLSTLSVPADVSSSAIKSSNKIDTFVMNSTVTNSEILWCLKVVMNHLSFNSCMDHSRTFQLMFPDSTFARKFHCHVPKLRTQLLYTGLHLILLITFYSHYRSVRLLLLVSTKL